MVKRVGTEKTTEAVIAEDGGSEEVKLQIGASEWEVGDAEAVIGEEEATGDDREDQRRSVGVWEVKDGGGVQSKEEKGAAVGQVRESVEERDAAEENRGGDATTEAETRGDGVVAVILGDLGSKEVGETAVRVSGAKVTRRGGGAEVGDGDGDGVSGK